MLDDRNKAMDFLIGCTVGATFCLIMVAAFDPHTPAVAEQVCYEPYGQEVEPEYIINRTDVEIRWVTPADLPRNVEAQATYTLHGNWSSCLIEAQLPEHILGDPKMDALGHELLHCLTGNFHAASDQ